MVELGPQGKECNDMFPKRMEDFADRMKICEENLEKYVAHQARKKHSTLSKQTLRCGLLPHQAVVVIDHKQKFLPQAPYETQEDYFGKAGITIFGATAIVPCEGARMMMR